ncbi:MAG TPA: methylated-DNA--[protein]-cysteine S-methyltransferase [Bacteroidales bacterium]|nr:methylated-DNA--[protein]-cysteine S-methyltransferase [Bacteroidales bacterium]HPS62002.1 methylated-DNA--[protein]-cysteine S-methyltransferase [Bacteroidales bacterium]
MSPIHQAFLKTPIGYVEVTGSENGISSLHFLDFRVRPRPAPPQLRTCITQLEEYFHGTRKEFDLKLDLQGSEFQLRVWDELQKIPYGTAITYHELAQRIGNVNAFRAVGGANGQNPVSVIVPCHRVIGSNGRLVGYRGGLKRKKWLLEHEHAFVQRDLFYGKL